MPRREPSSLWCAWPLAAVLFAAPALAEERLRVEAPAADAALPATAGSVVVRGVARAELFEGDVVIALDASNSALLASGLDLDDDGVLGATRAFAEDEGRFVTRHAAWTTDGDDSVLRAELVAAGALIDALDLRANRIGLLTYTARPRVRAPVGSPARARDALARVPVSEDKTGTDVAKALRMAAGLLLAAPPPGAKAPQRAILLGTDGEPTVPVPDYTAKRRALREARRLAEQGIALYVLAFGAHVLGQDGEGELAFLRELARVGRGWLVEVDAPERLLEDLPPARPELVIVNRTSGAQPLALRRERGGAFEARVPLLPGANEIEVSARWPGGRQEAVRRTVWRPE